jgi:putative PLP-dependent aminotransferase (TIGR04422 family)
MKIKSNHIWYQKPFKLSSPKTSNYSEVENFLTNNFKNGYAVLVSSGRAAIAVLLNLFWTSDTINIFKYASQCVVNACNFSGVSPSTSIETMEDMFYHQWGYSVSKKDGNIFIEDACDSFKPLGSKVRNLESRFEIWSLSKILGIRSGAIIWCKNEVDAQKLKNFRDSKREYNLKIFIKPLIHLHSKFYIFWEYLELTNCSLNKFQVGAINKEVMNWEQLYATRHKLFKSKIKTLRKLGDQGKIANENEIISGTLLPAVLIGEDEIKNFSGNSICLHRINLNPKPQIVRIIPLSAN